MKQLGQNSQKHTGRIIRYDYARAVCMIWIVGVWHLLSDYVGVKLGDITLCSYVTGGVLSAFFYISGRISARTEITSPTETLAYIKHKLISIYPLYLISAASLIYFQSGSTAEKLKAFLLTATCINTFCPPMTVTLWFLTMLILFYLITPFFLCRIRLRYRVAAAVLIYFALTAEHLTAGIFDSRLLAYFPVYVIALLMPKSLEDACLGIRGFLCSSVLLIAAVFITYNFPLPVLAKLTVLLVYRIAFVVCLLGVCQLLGKCKISLLYRLVFFISSASAFAYLFHRQYYGVWKRFISPFPLPLALIVIFPSLLALAYTAQALYKKAIKKN